LTSALHPLSSLCLLLLQLPICFVRCPDSAVMLHQGPAIGNVGDPGRNHHLAHRSNFTGSAAQPAQSRVAPARLGEPAFPFCCPLGASASSARWRDLPAQSSESHWVSAETQGPSATGRPGFRQGFNKGPGEPLLIPRSSTTERPSNGARRRR
jgi:hypothetical protein